MLTTEKTQPAEINALKESRVILLKFIIPAIFYFAWINCIVWTGHVWTALKLDGSYRVLNYMLFSFSHAWGILAAGLYILRKPLDVLSPGYNKLMSLAAALTLFCSLLQMAAGPRTLLAVNMLAGFCGGLYLLLLLFYMHKCVPTWKRGLSLGIACSAGTAVNYILFIILFPQYEGPLLYAKTVFTALLPLIGGIVFIIFRINSAIQEDTGQHHNNQRIPASFYFLVLIICILFYFVVGIQDGVASFEWFRGGNFLLHARIMYIIAALVGGYICDIKGRHYLILTSISLMTAGCISMMYAYDSTPAFIFLMCVMVGLVTFDIFIRLIFIDIAGNSKYMPVFCGIGFILGYVIRPLGIKFSAFVVEYDIQTLFVAGLLIALAMLPATGALLEALRNIYMQACRTDENMALAATAEQPVSKEDEYPEVSSDKKLKIKRSALDDFITRYDITKREIQVLDCILAGCSVNEMSRLLFVTESTVKFHVGNILKKANTKNRMELLILMTKSK